MPIINTSFESTLLQDGRISYVLRFHDTDGTEYLHPGSILPAGFDTEAFIQAKVIEKDAQLAEEEFNRLIGL